jgi:hypothetical protein
VKKAGASGKCGFEGGIKQIGMIPTATARTVLHDPLESGCVEVQTVGDVALVNGDEFLIVQPDCAAVFPVGTRVLHNFPGRGVGGQIEYIQRDHHIRSVFPVAMQAFGKTQVHHFGAVG